MANQISEETKITLDLKTIGILLFFVATVIGMWFTLQADIEEAKELPEPTIPRIEFEMKDKNTRTHIDKNEDDIEEIKDRLIRIEDKIDDLRR